MKKKWWLVVILIVVLALGGGWFYFNRATPSAKEDQVQTPQYVEKKHVKLVALGDSLTHGQGDETNNGGYVGVIKKKIEHHYQQTTVTTVNYGVSGDRSDQILDRLNSQKQIRSDLADADVITMTVGGNDLMQHLEADALESPKKISTDVDSAESSYRKKLHALFSAVRKQNPDAPIFVMSIYNPFYTYFPDVTTISDAVAKWNQTTTSVMGDYQQMYFVDINHLMSYGQYKTAASRQHLVAAEKKANGGKVSQGKVADVMNEKDHNINDYISTDDNFHPNHRGYEQIAKKLFTAMKEHNSWEYTKR
ncbi:SGNH/GDSL hydrolase family protein [Limosilactobacillus sp.]|jgi:lysophospholipase L1-like esterase|uniref:SGNH/GDSL hydrolase family protein n=1 Tax=Limosilactobacillus sp. TaxID=2773925 RepID=UPI0025C27B3B|nr:SGNH/GDSL hydrolase family protein [Limosilactobacillus sp.]MCH3922708.1 SGNH/GDSL hydrolase family protein [Limosilactobacillus sp.]MCH3927391.1 SGNH/GDSL hydrolase family protein [Limosilactobacillus sp.]